ncbi:MAG TPA: cadherin-like beta sandwich domain-containing protein [Nitrospiria bacterium]|nr:cadherin-like beta sandwich domain-containing protein [Nitrospiria bacterium]
MHSAPRHMPHTPRPRVFRLPSLLLALTLVACGGGGGASDSPPNADLAGLTLSIGSLSPAFDPAATDYTATTGFLSPSVNVTPTAASSGATITVNGVATPSGVSSAPITLAEGDNAVFIDVTASDGTTKRYTVTIAHPNAASLVPPDYLKASNSGASDRFGKSVALDGDTLVVGAALEDSAATGVNSLQGPSDNSATDSGAVYVFVRANGAWSQQAYIKPSNTGAGDQFGFSVALSGDTLVVGAPREDSASTGVGGKQTNNQASNSGAVYVFVRTNGVWSQRAYLKASNSEAQDHFGSSVALAGDTLVVGSPGEDSSATGVNGDQGDNASTDSGAAYVFVRNGTTWQQQAYLKASTTDANPQFGDYPDQFGFSVAVDGNTLAVGAIGEDSNAAGANGNAFNNDNNTKESGAAYVFTRSADTWTLQAYLKASNPAAGDWFGYSVALDGDTLAVGAIWEDSGTTGVNGDDTNDAIGDSGAAYVFVRNSNAWMQQAYIKASNPGVLDAFGYSLALERDTLVVGARNEASNATGVNGDQTNNAMPYSGAAYAFMRNGATWSQQAYLKASNTGPSHAFGGSLSLSGDTLAVTADGEGGATDAASGAVYVLQ